MQEKKSISQEFTFGTTCSTGSYVSSYAGTLEFQVNETAADGTQHRIELRLPIADAERLVKEAQEDLDKHKAKLLEEAEAEREAAEEALLEGESE